MKKIYVAGKYSADNVVDVLKNIGRGQKACAKLFELGFAPFCPWHDKSFITDNPNGEFTVEQFYDYSIAWLEVCDAMLVISGQVTSKGVKAEIEIAKKLDIPIFSSVKRLINYFEFVKIKDHNKR